MSDIRDNQAQSRFELEVEGHMAIASYVRSGDVMMFTHTETPPALRNRGVGEKLVLGALEQVRAQGLKARPMCSFVRFVMSRHPEFNDLLA